MSNIKRWKESLENVEELAKLGAIELTDDDKALKECSHHVTRRYYSEEDIKGLPEEWQSHVAKGHCELCDHEVFFRDNAPKGPIIVCIECAMETMMNEGDGITLRSRQSSTDELKQIIKRKEEH